MRPMFPRRRAVFVMGLCLSLSACKSKGEDGGPGASSSAAPPTAEAFCQRVMGAPLAAVNAKCPTPRRQDGGFDESSETKDYGLARHVELQVDACRRMLDPSVAAGRIALPETVGTACAKAIAADPWKEALTVRGVGWYLASDKACEGVMVGNQGDGAPCALNVECKEGLSCRLGADGDEGVCVPAPSANAPCARPRYPGLALEARGACGPGLYCNFETVTEKVYASAKVVPDPNTPSPSIEGSFLDEASHAPVVAPSESDAGRSAALRAAAEFGMIGLLNTGDADGAGRGEGIGLGDIGTIGRGAGTGTGSGFGSGGRLGGKKPPQVRMGSVSVAGRLPPEVIQRIVRQNFGRFRLCYENGLRTKPSLAGRVVVRFVIGRDGTVSNVAGSGDLPDKGVIGCVQKAFYGLTFPQPEGGVVTVSYPLVFSPGAGAPPASAGPASSAQPSLPGASAAPLPSGPTGPKNVCAPLVAEGSACWESWQCADGLGCRDGKCTKEGLLAAGGGCRDQTDCATGLYCDGTCKARKTAGEPCRASIECNGACGRAGACVAWCGAE